MMSKQYGYLGQESQGLTRWKKQDKWVPSENFKLPPTLTILFETSMSRVPLSKFMLVLEFPLIVVPISAKFLACAIEYYFPKIWVALS